MMTNRTDLALPTFQTGIITLPTTLQLGICHSIPLPPLGPSTLLIRTSQLALNHADYKMPSFHPTANSIAGSDFCGTVVALGSLAASSGRFTVGDTVAGATQGSNTKDLFDGAFAEYVVQEQGFCWKVPMEMRREEAAAMGGAVFGTVVLALYKSLGLVGTPGEPWLGKTKVLVYGGSSACGTMAIQMLKLSGYDPVATCSPHNFALVKSYGAATLFDHRSPTCASDIRAHCNGALAYALDTITDARSVTICHSAIGRAGGRYTSLDRLPDETGLRRTVKRDWVMGPEISGKGIGLPDGYGREASDEARAFGEMWFGVLERLMKETKLRAHPVESKKPGFEGILEAMDELKRKGTSGKKFVCRVKEGHI